MVADGEGLGALVRLGVSDGVGLGFRVFVGLGVDGEVGLTISNLNHCIFASRDLIKNIMTLPWS